MKRFFSIASAVCALAANSYAADIVDTAVAAGSFKTLVKLVQDAGLVETLKSAGPFTVFAPTDEAFAKVPAATLAGLAADKEKLKKVLTYHVVSGKVMAADVKTGPVKTVEGSSAKLMAKSGSVTIDKAKVVKADIACDNGVIHVIDALILPKM
ncbi:MAG: fasciclin domain-containing protein [Bryobacteraceae bacterium]|nr:fasciclin domain-containing protein [Bryobacteraceae bacterium]